MVDVWNILKDHWIESGVWRYLRHPNYLGEIVMWYMLWLTASSSFRSGWEYATLLCPTYNAIMILFVSGIPLLAKRGLEKWGDNPDYQAYLKRTKRIIPFVW